MLLFYLRHGDPIYDPDSLTPLGRRQAEALSRRLSLYGLDEIYVSSSQRAIETAQPTCEVLKLQPTVLDWTNENHAWEELSVETEDGGRCWCFDHPVMKARFLSPEVRQMDERWHEHPDFAGTTFSQGIERIRRETRGWLKEAGYDWDPEKNMYRCEAPNDRRVALFAHHGFGMAFLSVVTGVPYPQFATHFNISHSGMTVIHFPNATGWVAPQILQLSNDSHLLRDGLPTCYNNQFRF